MAKGPPPKPSYVGAAFGHWLNLGMLAAGTAAGVLWDPAFFYAVLPVEAAILWVLPGLPPFQHFVDRRFSTEEIAEERRYFLDQLWGLRPLEHPSRLSRVASWFFATQDEHFDHRVVDRRSREFASYLEMRGIVAKVRELVNVRGVRITPLEIHRLEQTINGYLRLLVACEPLAKAVDGADEKALGRDVASLKERVGQADASVRLALGESLRLKEEQLARLPKMKATLILMRTRAESIVHQLRNIHSQVLADPGSNVNSMLDEMIEQREMLADPLGDLAADQIVRDLLQQGAAAQKGKHAGEDNVKAAAAAHRQSVKR